MRLTLLIAALMLASASVLPDTAKSGEADNPSTGKCAFDREAMLTLDFNAFDQGFDGGWRAVAKDEDCTLIAADLIREYIDRHESDETIIVFHEGQMRAKGGQTARAIELMLSTREPDGQNSYFGWNFYIDATIAFLEKDKQRLIEARDALAALPKPGSFRAVDRDGKPVEMQWPPNMSVVNGFVDCFEESYAVAYRECSGL
ncbi:MAG: hypothetical protein QNJ19_12705 [Woeseiaceae bacterium]|nr:hypothetical protein [Woeseiaceae bacterium]